MKIVLATGNAKKCAEMQALLDPLAVDIVPQSTFNIPAAIENGLSFIENAIIKARHATWHCNLPAIADDSGLEVDALDGAPGIYSARYAGQHADDAANNKKLIDQLKNVQDTQRSARFRCCLAFVRHAEDPCPIIAEGSWEGRIVDSLNSSGGFGYDPLFYLAEQGCTAAQLSKEEKNALSHRAKAGGIMLKRLQDTMPQLR